MAWFIATSVSLIAATIVYWQMRRARQMAEQLRNLQQRLTSFEHAVAYLNEGLLLLGPHQRVQFANPAALSILGLNPEADYGSASSLLEFTGSVDLADAISKTNPEQTVRRVVMIQSAAGQERQTRAVEFTASPVGNQNRLLLLRDLQAQENLDRKRRDFVANASHELQTPIAAIIGMLDLLDSVSPEKRVELVEKARRNAESLSDLTRDLLGLARAQDPDWKPSPQNVPVRQAIEEILQVLEPKAAGKSLQLISEVSPEDLVLLIDPLSFETVLRNLAGNAIAYSDDGVIRVRVWQRPGQIVAVEVSDTGPGIDPEILPRIFERFFRGDPARSRASGGTGLGLAIVRNLVGRMGGYISVASEPGAGTRFVIELPVNPARPLQGAGQTVFR